MADVTLTWCTVAGFRTAVITLCSRENKLNVLNREVLAQLTEAVDTVRSMTADCEGLVICSAHDNFMAGADVKAQLELASNREAKIQKLAEIKAVFDNIEALPFPSVAILCGHVLGGGLELAMACRHRLVDGAASLGLPEVKLGLIPGGGGVVRLPRLIGLVQAVPLLVSGAPISHTRARRLGLVDDVVVQSQDDAHDNLRRPSWLAHLERAWGAGRLRGDSGSKWPLCLLGHSWLEQAMLHYATVRQLDAKTRRMLPAPYICLDVALRAWNCKKAPSDAMALESDGYLEASATLQARAAMRLFVTAKAAMARANANARVEAEPAPIPTASASAAADGPFDALRPLYVVLGVTRSGVAVAQGLLFRGCDVLLCGAGLATEEALDSAEARVAALFAPQVAKKRLSAENVARLLTRLVVVADTQVPYPNDRQPVVIECLSDDVGTLECKQQAISAAQTVIAPAHSQHGHQPAVVLSYTRCFTTAQLAVASPRPRDVLAIAMLNAERNASSVVELVGSEGAGSRALRAAVGLVSLLGKTPVLVSDAAGGVVHRVALAWFAEAALLAVEGGASVARIDSLLTQRGFSHGPFAAMDTLGLATVGCLARGMSGTVSGPTGRVCDGLSVLVALADEMVLRGFHGATAIHDSCHGTGFYRWLNGKRQGANVALKGLLQTVRSNHAHEQHRHERQQRAAATGAPVPGVVLSTKRLKQLSNADVVACLYGAVSNAACQCVAQGLAPPSEIDMVLCTGLGCPPLEGGPLFAAAAAAAAVTRGKGVPEPSVRDLTRLYGVTSHPWLEPHPLLSQPAKALCGDALPKGIAAATKVTATRLPPFFLEWRLVFVLVAITCVTWLLFPSSS